MLENERERILNSAKVKKKKLRDVGIWLWNIGWNRLFSPFNSTRLQLWVFQPINLPFLFWYVSSINILFEP